ncbi:hypothetical protein Goshw_027773 [Gossypium schwendimanii]|uniref:Very-long-chain aldehyde decarbonylase CER1-like C-terminal domain-containing protein n=1 Tax=Gossypium schwendimanii TaxID=34291 RepID=A0A7J9ME60_GOSSC|nr:hypothetical protein [Gossypium schwendimanii]
MNNMGHCNFELIPNWVFSIFPPLKYLMYTPSIYRRTFVVERNRFDQIRLQTWAIPTYRGQYCLKRQKESINNMIEEAVLEAEEKELNRYGEVYVKKHPQLKVKLVDGSSLAVAVLLNSIPKGTTQVLLRGNLTKVAFAVTFALCQKGIQVICVRMNTRSLTNHLAPSLRITSQRVIALARYG